MHDPVAAMVQVALEGVAEAVGAHYMYQKIVSKTTVFETQRNLSILGIQKPPR